MKIILQNEIEEKHRLIILTDMENEEDDSQTMVRLLMYANEVDIEGLIAVTSASPKCRNESFPNSIKDRVLAYGLVREQLMKHASGWPTKDLLLSKIGMGPQAYGMCGVGKGFSTNGVQLIIDAVDKNDTRPVYIAINAGANCLAQALWKVKNSRDKQEIKKFVDKIRVYDNTGQDDAGAWILSNFPEMFYIRSQSQVSALYGPDQEVENQLKSIDKEGIKLKSDSKQPKILGPNPYGELSMYEWVEKNIRVNHGILGALYPHRMMGESLQLRFMEGGGTTSWIGLINKGLYDPSHINWGGWGGRFETKRKKVISRFAEIREVEKSYENITMFPQAVDSWTDNDGNEYINSCFAPVWRWRQAYTNDFKARMDWCVKEYKEANHHPVAVIFGDKNRTIVHIEANPGEKVMLDASLSYDPDGDKVNFNWYQYKEAGTFKSDVKIKGEEESVCYITIPEDAKNSQIHIILEVSDCNSVTNLTAYRRVLINVV